MKKSKKIFALSLLVAAALLLPDYVNAESSQGINANPKVELNFQINIPSILYLQVGSEGDTVDLITFNVSNAPGTGAVAGNITVPVTTNSIVPKNDTVTLTANSSSPLTDGINTIPFSEISWVADGDLSGGTFDNSVNQKLDQFTDVGARSGKYTFYYDNNNFYPASSYSGTVTYTLSSP